MKSTDVSARASRGPTSVVNIDAHTGKSHRRVDRCDDAYWQALRGHYPSIRALNARNQGPSCMFMMPLTELWQEGELIKQAPRLCTVVLVISATSKHTNSK